MAAKYCGQVGCGAKTEYTAKVPAFCSSCGQPFGAAFAKVAAPSRSTPSPSVTSKASISRPVRRDPSDESVEGDEGEQYDEGEVLDRAQEIAASFSVSDFFSSVPVDDRRLSVADMLDPKKQVNVGIRGGVVADPSQLPRLPE